METEKFCRFVCGGFSLTSPANDQSSRDSVPMCMDHDEMG